MVMARIHIICGNCGADSKQMKLRIERDVRGGKEDDEFSDEAIIICENCSTLHFLKATMPMEKAK